FSSRRRYTRFSRDWSSDVCSSDLKLLVRGGRGPQIPVPIQTERKLHIRPPVAAQHLKRRLGLLLSNALGGLGPLQVAAGPLHLEIGRASCRGRVEMSGAAAETDKE